MTLNMGPQHPSTHGVLRLELVVDGELVVDVTPHIGYLHRCFEKHAENVSYQGVLPYIDRMDYLAAMNNEWPYVAAVEKMLGLRVPERVEYIRVIMAELNRIASHLVAIGTYGLDTGAFTPFLYCFRDREKILDIFELSSGQRLLYNYFQIGGLLRDMPPQAVELTRQFIDYFPSRIDTDINRVLTYNDIFIERTADVGILPADVAIDYGITGPNLRGSGVKWDLRRNEPYSIYDRFEFDIPVGTGEYGTPGDCWNRHIVRIREMHESCKIIRQALKQLPEGNVFEKIPRNIRPPAGEAYVRMENPRGELGFYVVSDGTNKPARVKGRAPAFLHVSVLPEIARGALIADLVAIVGSLDIVLGEVDR